MNEAYEKFLALGCFDLSEATDIFNNVNTAKSALLFLKKKGYIQIFMQLSVLKHIHRSQLRSRLLHISQNRLMYLTIRLLNTMG